MAATVASFILSTSARPAAFALAFAILALPLALVLATVIPFGGVFDESVQAARAESLSAGELLGGRGEAYWYDYTLKPSTGFHVDKSFFDVHEVWTIVKVTAAEVRQSMERHWADTRDFLAQPFIVRYFPVFYVPAALAIVATKLAGGSPYAAFMDGRFANLAIFAALGIGTLLLARRGQALMLGVLSLPMTLSLGGSLNQDGLFIACSVLGVALLTRVIEEPGTATAERERTIAAVLIGMIGLAKLPYSALAPLLLLPLPCTRRTILPRLRLALITALPSLLWGAYAIYAYSVPWPLFPPYSPGPLWPGPPDATFETLDAAAQLHVLAANPFRIISLTFDAFTADDPVWRTTVGLLPIGIMLSNTVHYAWTIALPAAGIATLCVVLIAICMSQYLTWTKLGSDHIDMSGQFGRYLLPLLPALALGLPVLRGPRFAIAALILSIPVGLASLIRMAEVPRVVIGTFYVR